MASGFDLALLFPIFATGIVLLTYGLVALAQFLRLGRAGASLPSDFTGGLVSLDGTVAALSDGETVTSPLTGESTCWYEYRIERRGGDLTRPNWDVVASGSDGRPFVLETADGQVAVDPEGATVEVSPSTVETFDADPEDLETVPSIVASESPTVDPDGATVDLGLATLDAGEHYRLVERRIAPGDELRVSGSARNAAGRLGDRVTVTAPTGRSRLEQLLGAPLEIGSSESDGARGTLRDRVLVGLVFGLPLVMLSVVFAFPPAGV